MLRSSLLGTSVATSWGAQPQPIGDSRWRFPPADQWPAQDVIAAGADLEPATLIAAYRHGIFPMPLDLPDRDEPLLAWWSPESRGILPLDNLRRTRSLRQSAKRFEVRVDTAFEAVIRACANPARPSAWITPAFISAYLRLHHLGWAHSVEVFDRQGVLAGGLYGIRIDRLFAGESMFHLQRDASKVALAALVDLMRESRMALLDVQWQSEHLQSLGVIEVPRGQYLELLRQALSGGEDAKGEEDAEAQSAEAQRERS
jgi:leucyl/phenylalanyl-tRNA--protein transferase